MRDSLKTKLIAKNREGEYKALGTALEKKSEGKTRVSLTMNESPFKF